MTEMTHDDALQELAVERYLLDELTGEARDRFEIHLFDCTICAEDLKQGMIFLEGARQELRANASAVSTRVPAEPSRSFRSWWSGLLQPLVLGPALAASLCVVAYQSAVLLPHKDAQLAQLQTPSVVSSLVLAGAGSRGDGAPDEIFAGPGGVYLLSVDLPPAPGASAYRCTLYDSSGNAVWHTDVPVRQDVDTIRVQVPVAATGPGNNRFDVQAVNAQNGSLTNLATYKYNLRLGAY